MRSTLTNSITALFSSVTRNGLLLRSAWKIIMYCCIWDKIVWVRNLIKKYQLSPSCLWFSYSRRAVCSTLCTAWQSKRPNSKYLHFWSASSWIDRVPFQSICWHHSSWKKRLPDSLQAIPQKFGNRFIQSQKLYRSVHLFVCHYRCLNQKWHTRR